MGELVRMAQGVLHHIHARSVEGEVSQVQQQSGEEESDLHRCIVVEYKVNFGESEDAVDEEYLDGHYQHGPIEQIELVGLGQPILLLVGLNQGNIGSTVDCAVYWHDLLLLDSKAPLIVDWQCLGYLLFVL